MSRRLLDNNAKVIVQGDYGSDKDMIHSARDQGKDLSNVDFTGLDLTGVDLSGLNLANAKFSASTIAFLSPKSSASPPCTFARCILPLKSALHPVIVAANTTKATYK